MKKYEYNCGKNPEGILSTISGYATETTNFGETAFGILNKSTRDKSNFTTPEVVSSSTATLFSVGNGSDGIRKNIIELKADGTVLISGVGGYDGTNPDAATGIADKMQGIEDSVDGFEEALDSISVVKDETNDLVYTLMVDGEERGSINIPKDQFLKSVTYDEDTNEFVFTFVTSESDNQEVRVSIPGLSEIPSLDNCVTLDGDQTITGNKTFNTNVVATGFAVSEGTSDEVLTADGGTISTDELVSKVPQPDLSPLQTAIGSNTYEGSNYLTKETNLTDAVIQLDEEIKATNDNLALEHANAEAAYAKKTDVPTNVSQLTNDAGYQTEAQVSAKVSALVDSAPETLNTLNKLAAALGDDPNFATTVTNQMAGKADAVHTHLISDVTDLQSTLDKKATKEELNAKVSGTGVSSIQVVTALPDVQEEGVLYIVTGEEA